MAGQTFVAVPAGARTGSNSGPGLSGILGAVGGYFNGGSTPSSFNPNPVGSTSISPYSSFATKLASGGYAQPAPTSPFSSSTPSATTSSGGSQVGTSFAYRQLNATSETPGSFTTTSDRWWMTVTLSVKPASGGGGSPTNLFFF